MRTRRSPRTGNAMLRLGGRAILAALVVGPQTGCTREFFREWANQDVSEAIFEKSRDPRWRLDTFSIEAPALSRFADPYDQDAPPAPPDDVATEALSPVPQWPSNRLIVPVEGTGYLELLEYWKRQDMVAAGLRPRARRRRPPRRSPGCRSTWASVASRCRSAPIPASRRVFPSDPTRAWPTPSSPATSSTRARPSTPTSRRAPRPCRSDPRRPASTRRPGTGYPGAPGGAGMRRRPWRPGTRVRRPARPRLSPDSPSNAPPGPPPGVSPSSPSNAPASESGRCRRLGQPPPGRPVRSDHPDRPPPGRAGDPPPAGYGPIRIRSRHEFGDEGLPFDANNCIERGEERGQAVCPAAATTGDPGRRQTTGPRGGKDRMVARVAFQDEPVSGGTAPPAGRPAPTGWPAGPGAASTPPARQPPALARRPPPGQPGAGPEHSSRSPPRRTSIATRSAEIGRHEAQRGRRTRRHPRAPSSTP